MRDLLWLSDASMTEFQREHARWLPPSVIKEDGDLLLCAAGTGAPGPWNSAIALGPQPPASELVFERARRFFEPKKRPCLIYVRAHADAELEAACVRAGLPRGGESPGMALSSPVAAPVLPDAARIERVVGDAAAAEYREVMAEAYEDLQLPAAVTRKVLAHPERWLSPRSEAYVLRDGEQALAGAYLLFSHGIAGVYWVGTLRAARGRGCAEALTRFVSNRAFEAGARAVVLQASRGGEPIYRRIGYEEVTRYRWYLLARANG